MANEIFSFRVAPGCKAYNALRSSRFGRTALALFRSAKRARSKAAIGVLRKCLPANRRRSFSFVASETLRPICAAAVLAIASALRCLPFSATEILVRTAREGAPNPPPPAQELYTGCRSAIHRISAAFSALLLPHVSKTSIENTPTPYLRMAAASTHPAPARASEQCFDQRFGSVVIVWPM